MKRIIYMVIRHLFQVPVWFFHISYMGRHKEKFSEEERYGYLRKMVQKINRSGRVDVKACSTENIPAEGGFILFPNHQGLFDMLALVDTCPRPLGVVVKKEASDLILVKQVIRLLDGFSMDRTDIKASLEIIQRMSEEVKSGKSYVIFPEGTRSREGNQILPFKAGTFKSAVNAGCPIVPVAMINSFKPFDIPSIKKEQVQVHYLEPLYPNQYVGLKTKEIADIVHDKIEEAIQKNT